ncbi:RpiB/LacA/LacB family sugar-phosphate isomerase [Candidatus Marsarchaeota archaeon]|nr:RpiB/LacA/LacB family sugar-phosphate isomerase [Candidatus Marsarchaeota archaeon]
MTNQKAPLEANGLQSLEDVMIDGVVKRKEEQKIAAMQRQESPKHLLLERFYRVKTADVVYIASDHGGFELKNALKGRMMLNGHMLVDMGPDAFDKDDDYPDYAERVCKEMIMNGGSGILICRSGHGMAVAANKFRGIYASVCCNEESAFKAKKDDNTNVLCLAGDATDIDLAEKIVVTWLETPYESVDRRNRRAEKIRKIEEANFRS